MPGAGAIAQAIYETDKDLILVGLANSEMIKAGKKLNLKVANEVFADRAYNKDGTLVSRKKEGAMIHDEEEAILRVLRMVKEGKVLAITGEDIDIQADTICVHGDNPRAVEFVEKIKRALQAEGIEVVPMGSFIK
ncbi:MAG: LamB/YcsF family protein [Sedimentibacter sp.]|nr:LamB/YcsF family protein [Sedimentibacter sp.]